MKVKIIVLLSMIMGLSFSRLYSQTQNLPQAIKVGEVGGGILFNDPRGIIEYRNGYIILNNKDTIRNIRKNLGHNHKRTIKMKPGPNGPVLEINDSLLLRGKIFLYEGECKRWFPCPQGAIIEKIVGDHRILSINGVKTIYQSSSKKKIDWLPTACLGPYLVFVEKDKKIIGIKDNGSDTIPLVSNNYSAGQSEIIFEKRHELCLEKFGEEPKTIFEGKYSDAAGSALGCYWSTTGKKGITNIFLNGRLVWSDYCNDWGPIPQGLQVIQGNNIILVPLE